MATLEDMRVEAGLLSCQGFEIDVRCRDFNIEVRGRYDGNGVMMTLDYVDVEGWGVFIVNKVWETLLCHNFNRVDYG